MARKRQRPRSDLEVYLRGHCTRIGDGLRGVQIVKVGRLWVTFKETHSCRTCRVAKAIWQKLEANAYSRRIA